MYYFAISTAVILWVMLLLPFPVTAQTPDGSTPAEEAACDKYEGEGARHGLCIAYCEAQDCNRLKESNPSCATIAQRFIDYSVKRGYVKSPKEKPTISCTVTACTKDDVAFCGGQERDCDTDGDGVCEDVCTARFVGFSGKDPLCAAVKCTHCVGEDPKK